MTCRERALPGLQHLAGFENCVPCFAFAGDGALCHFWQLLYRAADQIRPHFAGHLQQSGQSDEAVTWCSSATAPRACTLVCTATHCCQNGLFLLCGRAQIVQLVHVTADRVRARDPFQLLGSVSVSSRQLLGCCGVYCTSWGVQPGRSSGATILPGLSSE